MRTITAATTLGEIAARIPEATRIFEDFGIDYCCGGKKSLEDACASSKISAQDVLQLIQGTQDKKLGAGQMRDWAQESLASLIAHIRGTHHKYTRGEIARITPMLRKVLSVHGTNHPELQRITGEFEALASELLDHMIDEEIVLFPYITRMEECGTGQRTAEPSGLSSLRGPVATLVFQHDSAGDKLRAIRQASGNYRVPEDACMTYRSVFRALADLETDLHQHIHLENNILFPRATAVEEMLPC
jgi:regulator of cell morphogenesis and NO signaling